MKLLYSTLFSVLLLFSACQTKSPTAISKYVDPFIGTGGHGHTFPGATVPFGMVQLSPDTRLDGWDGCSGYHYSDSIIYGFSHTHLSGTGVSDYGDVLLMPIQGSVVFNNGANTDSEEGYSSTFQKKNEKAKAGFYEVFLDQHQIHARLTATNRVGIHEYTFQQKGPSHIILDLEHRDQLLEDSISISSKSEIMGSRISKAWATEQHIYFVIQFSKEFSEYQLDSSGKKLAISFATEADEKLMIKVGISAVSIEGARNNLKNEAPHWDFNTYQADANSFWEKALSKIQIDDQNEEKKTIFYSALYHTMIAPNTFSDVDGKYRGMDRKVHTSKQTVYTVFSLWDTFRATHPLFTLIEQEKTNEFIQTLLRQYQDGGELPIWELAGNYTGCMIGYHAIPVIVDGYIKGIRGYDAELALEAMQHSAQQDKLGLQAYKTKGFIEVGDESESVSKTLEYAYDDWCIAQMAKEMGNSEVYQNYIERAQNYKNLFNPEVGFMQSKINGAWSIGFNPAEVNFNFTEANSWQYSLFAPQDIKGLIKLYGGAKGFEEKLDQLFTTEMELAGREQADITGLIGQYAHGNEPSHHMAYLYNYIGKPYKTQERVTQILNEQYTSKPDGLSGNEDCGQMSAWYVLSSMGFYSVTPGLNYYSLGTPQFERATLHLENGNSFSIQTKKQNEGSFYIQSAKLNGTSLQQSFISHEAILKGGTLLVELGDQPNLEWASNGSPESKINEEDEVVTVPYFNTSTQTFTDSLSIELKSIDSNDVLFYQLNGGDFVLYNHPIILKSDAQISAYAKRGSKTSKTVKDATYKKIKGGRSIELLSEYSNQYAGGGSNGLLNYLRGGSDFRTGYWQGYYDTDFAAVVDLGKVESIQKISIGALQDIKSWIWFPKQVSFSISMDGKSFRKVATVLNETSDKEYGGLNQEFATSLPSSTKVRFVKVEAQNYGACPSWHLGNGNPSWLFFDEITIE